MSVKIVKNPLDKLPEILKKKLNKNLCVCNEVKKIDIIKAIAKGANTIMKVRDQTYATGGNGCCTRQVERLIECIHSTK
ncbi:(2Fe-2S)-binding protein [Candidatus Thioglobus sp.]|jgi:bacterioferritin-associated ferredoxin|uniref:(2Fe-2S)-binding protein n=1 Tax=Candidatus Thioglobus sp. TaxID=2026721 RepID=UPI00233C9077|nr:(2Fe-2S)-binding protein [Candidatus Thioglobus sp.]MDC0430644.1 (2Fe-2S)-binding protein [Candidatus Thioglobus sp.]